MTTPAAPVARPIGGPLAYLSEAVAAAAAVQTAQRLGVLARLDGGPVTAAELAAACAIGERGARLLLAALAALGLAEAVEGGAWRAALPDLAELAGMPWMWAHLEEALREGRPPVRGDTPAGAAPWSLAVAARDPACLVTAVDLPAVVPATRRAVSAAGYGRQFASWPATWSKSTWGARP